MPRPPPTLRLVPSPSETPRSRQLARLPCREAGLHGFADFGRETWRCAGCARVCSGFRADRRLLLKPMPMLAPTSRPIRVRDACPPCEPPMRSRSAAQMLPFRNDDISLCQAMIRPARSPEPMAAFARSSGEKRNSQRHCLGNARYAC